MVPAAIVIVAAVFEICFVVLVVVADQVAERVTVVRRDEVDAGQRAAAVVLEQVTTAAQSRADIAKLAGIALPELAHRVAELAVPLFPDTGELAEVVAAGGVPGFGDHLDLREHRVLLYGVEECGARIEIVWFATEHRGQVKAEAVDVHFLDPVPQAVEDQLQSERIVNVPGVAAAGEVFVVAAVFQQPVVLELPRPRKQIVGPSSLPSPVWL